MKTEWINVEDGLPPEYKKGEGVKYYLVRYEGYFPGVDTGFVMNGEGHRDFISKYTVKITHFADCRETTK